jgi:hypothetical protein
MSFNTLEEIAIMGDNEKLECWDLHEANKVKRCMELLIHALFVPDVGAMVQLFAQEGYNIGKYSKKFTT